MICKAQWSSISIIFMWFLWKAIRDIWIHFFLTKMAMICWSISVGIRWTLGDPLVDLTPVASMPWLDCKKWSKKEVVFFYLAMMFFPGKQLSLYFADPLLHKECAAVLIGLYRKNGERCCSFMRWNLSNHMHHGIHQGGSEVMISSWTGFNHGQILIETATHSLVP